MRFIAVAVLTLCQFTAFPFLAIVASNTTRPQTQAIEETNVQVVETENVTTVYKTAAM